MAAFYFDSSVLAKLYHSEVGTPKVVAIVEAGGAEIRISPLPAVELRSVFESMYPRPVSRSSRQPSVRSEQYAFSTSVYARLAQRLSGFITERPSISATLHRAVSAATKRSINS